METILWGMAKYCIALCRYDPDPYKTVIEEDDETVRTYFEMPEDDIPYDQMSPWLLRIELDKAMMLDKKLTTSTVAEKVGEAMGNQLHVIFSEDNAEKLVLRIRLINQKGVQVL